MKITHVIESCGGSADFVLYLVKYIPEFQHTIIHSDRTFGEKLDNVKNEFQKTKFIYWRFAQREVRLWLDIKASIYLYRILRDNPSDIIHLHSSKAGFLGRLVCLLLGKKKVIYTANGLSFLRQDVSSLKRKIYVILEKVAHAFAGIVVSCSKSEADELIKRGISSTYVNNGTEIFDKPYVLPKDKNGIIIATTGRVTIQKNPALFNKIAGSLKNDPDIQFLWIGGGELEHQLTSTNIKITGWMNRSNVFEQLHTADIYISTASWEGLPFAVIEAMNINKPLLLTRCIGNVDLVSDGYNGFGFDTVEDAASKIRLLKKNPSLRHEYGRNSHKKAKEHFNVEKMARNYREIYESIQ